MTTTTNPLQKTQSISSLPLLLWRSVVVKPSTRAGEFVARRYRIDPAIADVITDLAGLGSEVR